MSLLSATMLTASGALLVASGLVHITNIYYFAEAVARYKILPAQWIGLVALVLPAIQLVIGVTLTLQRTTTLTAAMASSIFCVFAAAQLKILMSGESISCGCFGMSSEPIGWRTISIPLFGITSTLLYLVTERQLPHAKANPSIGTAA